MPKNFNCFRICYLAALLMLLMSGGSTAAKDATISVKIRPGDSVSYLAFKHIHAYNQKIATKIKRLNPHLRDLNRILVGDMLYLPIAETKVPTGKTGEPVTTPSTSVTKKMTTAGSKAVITLVEGQAKMFTSKDRGWRIATVNSILTAGDKVKVLRKGRIELVLDNRSVLRLGPETQLELKEVERSPRKEKYSFMLTAGKMWTRVTRLLGFGSEYKVKTPTAITAVQGTVYDLAVDPTQQTRVRVFSGTVQVYNPFAGALVPGQELPKLKEPTRVPGPTRISQADWEKLVLQQHQQVTLGRDGRTGVTPVDPVAKRGEAWIDWNEARDRDFYST
jgi:hypothetical protein